MSGLITPSLAENIFAGFILLIFELILLWVLVPPLTRRAESRRWRKVRISAVLELAKAVQQVAYAFKIIPSVTTDDRDYNPTPATSPSETARAALLWAMTRFQILSPGIPPELTLSANDIFTHLSEVLNRMDSIQLHYNKLADGCFSLSEIHPDFSAMYPDMSHAQFEAHSNVSTYPYAYAALSEVALRYGFERWDDSTQLIGRFGLLNSDLRIEVPNTDGFLEILTQVFEKAENVARHKKLSAEANAKP